MSDSKNVITATDQTFQHDVLEAPGVSVVDFWAEWCGPCRMLGPTIDQLANDYAGKVKVYKMNVDENPQTPTRYSIRGIPTVLIIKGGTVVEQLVGNQPRDAFVSALSRHVG